MKKSVIPGRRYLYIWVGLPVWLPLLLLAMLGDLCDDGMNNFNAVLDRLAPIRWE